MFKRGLKGLENVFKLIFKRFFKKGLKKGSKMDLTDNTRLPDR